MCWVLDGSIGLERVGNVWGQGMGWKFSTTGGLRCFWCSFGFGVVSAGDVSEWVASGLWRDLVQRDSDTLAPTSSWCGVRNSVKTKPDLEIWFGVSDEFEASKASRSVWNLGRSAFHFSDSTNTDPQGPAWPSVAWTTNRSENRHHDIKRPKLRQFAANLLQSFAFIFSLRPHYPRL